MDNRMNNIVIVREDGWFLVSRTRFSPKYPEALLLNRRQAEALTRALAVNKGKLKAVSNYGMINESVLF
jgi:hypothetical protein